MNMTSLIIQDPAVRSGRCHGDQQGRLCLDTAGRTRCSRQRCFPDGFSSFGGENVKAEKFDPEGAAKVLEDAGWKDSDGDGVREKDGQKLTIRWLTYPSRQELPLPGRVRPGLFKDIGIELDINCTANRREFLAKMDSWGYLRLRPGHGAFRRTPSTSLPPAAFPA